MGDKKTIRVRCINVGEMMVDGIHAKDISHILEVGKIYEVTEHNPDQYKIPGNAGWIPYKFRFEVIDDKKSYTTSY